MPSEAAIAHARKIIAEDGFVLRIGRCVCLGWFAPTHALDEEYNAVVFALADDLDAFHATQLAKARETLSEIVSTLDGENG